MSKTFFLIAAVIYAVGYGSVQPALNTIVISLCPPHKRGAANAISFTSLDLGIGLGAFVWRLVSQNWGYPTIYLGCTGFMLLAVLAYLLMFRRKGKNEKL